MKKKQHTKLIHEGDYVAEVEVELIHDDEGWSPYLSMEDVNKLDNVRDALRRGNLNEASKSSKIYTLTPIAL